MPIRSILRVFFTEVLSKVVLGLSHIVIIKALPVPEFGRFSFLYATAFAVANFSGVALNRAMMVQAAQYSRADRHLVAGALPSIIGAALLMLVVDQFGHYARGEFASVGVFAFGFLIVDYLRSLHQSEMNFRHYVLIELVRSALVLLATVAALRAGSGGLLGAAEALLYFQGAAMLLLAIPWALWVRHARVGLDFAGLARNSLRQLDGERIALFLYFAAVGLLGQIEVFVLKRAGTEVALALFSAAFRYFSLLLMATGAMSAVLTPLSQKTDSAHSFLHLLKRGRAYFVFFSGLVVLSLPVLYTTQSLLGLEKYPGFFPVYGVLCLASIQAVFLSPHVSVLMRVKDYLFLNGVAYFVIVASVAACFVMVRAAGALGAALSYCVTNLVLNGLAYRRAHQLIRQPSPEPNA